MSGKGAGKPAMTSGDESDSVEEVDYTTVLRRLALPGHAASSRCLLPRVSDDDGDDGDDGESETIPRDLRPKQRPAANQPPAKKKPEEPQ
eukprot:symbB.v1.2.030546.t1/scaffold3453.1/size56350/6